MEEEVKQFIELEAVTDTASGIAPDVTRETHTRMYVHTCVPVGPYSLASGVSFIFFAPTAQPAH